MMSVEMFIGLLGLIAAVVALVVQKLKPVLDAKGMKYSTNFLALCTSAVTATVICVLFYIVFDVAWTVKSVAMIFAEMICGWGVSMFGYDKVVQLINQFIAIGKFNK